jgi:hypothetical protein
MVLEGNSARIPPLGLSKDQRNSGGWSTYEKEVINIVATFHCLFDGYCNGRIISSLLCYEGKKINPLKKAREQGAPGFYFYYLIDDIKF